MPDSHLASAVDAVIQSSHPFTPNPGTAADIHAYDRAMASISSGVVIADATQPDRPIIYCNPAFERLTGYSPAEVIGRNCRFLQGEDTDPGSLEQIRQAVRSGQGCQVVLKNYRKDGTPFWNKLTISLVTDTQGNLTHFIGVQTDQTDYVHSTEALQQQAERERLMRTITERIYQSVAVEETLQHGVEGVRHLLQVDRTLIYRFNPDWSGFVAVESVAAGWQSTVDTLIIDTCFRDTHVPLYQQGRVRVISDIYTAGLAQCHIELLERFQVKANLVVPILQFGKLWGLLIAHHCSAPRQWQTDEVELLQHLSVQLAIALHQSELHHQLTRELEERRQTELALRQSEQRLRAQAIHLEQALSELKHAQAQLVQSEKMSSLGQLVAGVAHEINNPVAFVCGNLKYVQQYSQDLLEIIRLYQTHYTDPAPAIQAALAGKDLDFVVQDLPKSMSSIQVGAERIQEIVRSLRSFSRLDEAGVKLANLQEGLDSTLMILASRLKAKPNCPAIDVVRQYNNLPAIQCYPGQLNQVFMNILSNAIDAIEERIECEKTNGCCLSDQAIGLTHAMPPPRRSSPHLQVSAIVRSASPQIQIQAECLDSKEIIIRITDNGIGIAPEIQHRLFEPFFTTKTVGRGTGLGLAISYQIVTKHQGQLIYRSSPLQGTEFVIRLPVVHPR